LAFLQIFGMEWVAMILEKNLDSHCQPGASFGAQVLQEFHIPGADAGFVFCRAAEIPSSVNG